MNWQPIETAPRDGTEVDLWVVDSDGAGRREPNAQWRTDVTVYQYDKEVGRLTSEGWAVTVDQTHVHVEWHNPDCMTHATHWMPLPPPPEG